MPSSNDYCPDDFVADLTVYKGDDSCRRRDRYDEAETKIEFRISFGYRALQAVIAAQLRRCLPFEIEKDVKIKMKATSTATQDEYLVLDDKNFQKTISSWYRRQRTEPRHVGVPLFVYIGDNPKPDSSIKASEAVPELPQKPVISNAGEASPSPMVSEVVSEILLKSRKPNKILEKVISKISEAVSELPSKPIDPIQGSDNNPSKIPSEQVPERAEQPSQALAKKSSPEQGRSQLRKRPRDEIDTECDSNQASSPGASEWKLIPVRFRNSDEFELEVNISAIDKMDRSYLNLLAAIE